MNDDPFEDGLPDDDWNDDPPEIAEPDWTALDDDGDEEAEPEPGDFWFDLPGEDAL